MDPVKFEHTSSGTGGQTDQAGYQSILPLRSLDIQIYLHECGRILYLNKLSLSIFVKYVYIYLYLINIISQHCWTFYKYPEMVVLEYFYNAFIRTCTIC
jgi:hypothetical protein